MIREETGHFINYANSKADPTRRISHTYSQVRLGHIIKEIWGRDNIQLEAHGNSIDILSKDKGKIEGTVTNREGEPVPFATVALIELDTLVIAEELGNFIFNQIEHGFYTLSITSIGYQPKQVETEVVANQTTKLEIELIEAVRALEEVVITDKLSEARRLENSAQAVTVVETQVAKLETADLGELLARTEGVSVQRAGGLGSNTRFSLNGLTDDQIRFFLDGIPLDLMGYTVGLANIPVNLVERAEIYKGVVPIQFGADALGGAVNLVSASNYVGTSGDASYQVGSFGTHRATLAFQHRPNIKGFFVGANTFFDYSNNNYQIDVEIPNARGRLSQETIRRFHDGFRSAGLNVNLGLNEVPWADLFSVRIFGSEFERDVQNNLIMTIPYGEVTNGNQSLGGLLRWKKNLQLGPEFDITIGQSTTWIEFQDLSQFVYNWLGERQRDLNGEIIIRANPGEIGDPTDIQLIDRAYYGRLNAKYPIGKEHQVQLSSAPTLTTRTGEDRLIADPTILVLDPLGLKSDLFNWVNGIEYLWEPTSKNLEYLAFVKNYWQSVLAEQLFVTDIIENNRETNEWGAGSSLRYQFAEKWSLKASYEWATRLPRATEIFGNGALILANTDLEPERSHNANLSLAYTSSPLKQSNWLLSINGFIRNTENLIVLLGSGQTFSNQNVLGATSQGVEVTGNWTATNKRLRVELGGTYQDFRNDSDEGSFSAFKGDRIPNRPYFFANGSLRYSFPNILGETNSLDLFGNTRYVHEFFRGWESIGNPDFKQVIPEQLVHNLGLTYSTFWASRKLSITGEVQNLTNEKIFDFFGVQRPGRAFFLKGTFDMF